MDENLMDEDKWKEATLRYGNRSSKAWGARVYGWARACFILAIYSGFFN